MPSAARGFIEEDVAAVLDAAFQIERAMAALCCQQWKAWLPKLNTPLQLT